MIRYNIYYQLNAVIRSTLMDFFLCDFYVTHNFNDAKFNRCQKKEWLDFKFTLYCATSLPPPHLIDLVTYIRKVIFYI